MLKSALEIPPAMLVGAFLAGTAAAVALALSPADQETATRAPDDIASAVATCEHRAELNAAEPIYANAWRAEAERARRGLGCRDNISDTGEISAD